MTYENIITDLQKQQGNNLITIYMPTAKVGREEENRIAFKNQVLAVRRELEDRETLSNKEIDELLKPATRLTEEVAFWQQQQQGLAMFLSTDRFEYLKLGQTVQSSFSISDSFRLGQLIGTLSKNAMEFYLLAISRGAINLYLASQDEMEEIDISGVVPEDMDSALLLDDPDANLQRAGGPEGSGKGVYFGHGAGKDVENGHLKAYFDVVDRGVQTLLKNDTRPLLLAGVEELIPIYREANGYNYLIESCYVGGNVEEDGLNELHAKAKAVIGDRFEGQQREDRENFDLNFARGEAAEELQRIVPAAVNGRVEILWVAEGANQRGVYTQKNNGVQLDENATQDLFDMAITQTYTSGGRVYVVPAEDMPRAGTHICATFRYGTGAPVTNLKEAATA